MANALQRPTVLVVEDDAAMREMLLEALSDEGYRVEGSPNGRAAADRVKQGGVDLLISDVRMPELDGIDLLREIQASTEPPSVITITAFGSIETAKRAIRLGAYDYITKPFEIDELLRVVSKALTERGIRTEEVRLKEEGERSLRFEGLLGRSDAMQQVFRLLRRVAPTDSSVLITGESGTGKELVARALHQGSPREKAEFVAVNCAAIPETLLESELFGYRRGAFTDAHRDHEGLFQRAQGGTIFLDEIAELAPQLQAKLLRVLQEREIRPLGALKPERVDVRVLAATNRNLEERLQSGQFREDLYYRLNVIHVPLPSLRDRPEDIALLSELFFAQSSLRSGKKLKGFREAALKALVSHSWPGNVRELENVIERAVALAEGEWIDREDLPAQLREGRKTELLSGALGRNLTLAELEKEYIRQVLDAEGGNKTRAAQRLGLDRKTLYRKIEEYDRNGGEGKGEP